MNVIQETTKWVGKNQPNHTYLMDGNQAVAYVSKNMTTPFYFKTPITIDMRGRMFRPGPDSLFKSEKDTRIKVIGSKGTEYFIDPDAKTCTCPGFLYRGQCKHIKDM